MQNARMIIRNIFTLIDDISCRVKTLSEIPLPIREFSREVYLLLQNKDISSDDKLDNILDALEDPLLSQAIESFPAFSLLKNMLRSELTRQEYFTDSTHFEMLKRCFFACYKNRPHILKELAAQPDYFTLFTYMLSISPKFIAYTDSRINTLIKIAERTNNRQAAERLQAIEISKQQSSDSVEIDPFNHSENLYSTACVTQHLSSKDPRQSEHCCTIM
jgi:hypothetical protein